MFFYLCVNISVSKCKCRLNYFHLELTIAGQQQGPALIIIFKETELLHSLVHFNALFFTHLYTLTLFYHSLVYFNAANIGGPHGSHAAEAPPPVPHVQHPFVEHEKVGQPSSEGGIYAQQFARKMPSHFHLPVGG